MSLPVLGSNCIVSTRLGGLIMSHRKYDELKVLQAVNSSTSIRQVLQKLGIIEAGGNYQTIKRFCKIHNIKLDHFTGKIWSKGKKIGSRKPVSVYLVKDCEYIITTHKLRKRLLSAGVFKHVCLMCQNTEWLGQPIPLELEHINGDSNDNRLENLRLLCPNCHAQTPTYRGKNQSRHLARR